MVLNDSVRQYYRDNPLMVSSPFGGVDGVNRDLLIRVFGQLGIDVSGRRILDVGCGRGYVGEVVEDLGGVYTGVDLVPSRTGFRLTLADAASLPFSDASFDGLFCIDVFEHIPDARRAAEEFHRVLRPGGFFFLSAPNYSNVAGLVKWWCEHVGGYARDSWAPFRGWQAQELEQSLTSRKLRRIFRNAGFTHMRRCAHGPEIGVGLFPWLEHPGMPEAIKFRMQRLFAAAGPGLARLCPGLSLHVFWHMKKQV